MYDAPASSSAVKRQEATASIASTLASVPYPQRLTTRLDWEVELGVVIGMRGRDIPEARALDYVFGYTIFNDVSARDLQYRTSQWFKGKALDGSCPMGPVIVSADEIPDPQRLRLQLRVNGMTKQKRVHGAGANEF